MNGDRSGLSLSQSGHHDFSKSASNSWWEPLHRLHPLRKLLGGNSESRNQKVADAGVPGESSYIQKRRGGWGGKRMNKGVVQKIQICTVIVMCYAVWGTAPHHRADSRLHFPCTFLTSLAFSNEQRVEEGGREEMQGKGEVHRPLDWPRSYYKPSVYILLPPRVECLTDEPKSSS